MSIAPPSNPPHAGCVGQWVSSRDFKGNKSFGYFQCNYCQKSWNSAHAMKGFKQACKECDRDFFPLYMWKNEPGSFNKRESGYLEDDKPHRSDLCQACKLGVCKEGGSRLFKGFGGLGGYRRSGYRPYRRW